MLTIEYVDVIEEIKMGELFSMLDFDSNTCSDDSGDSLVRNTWPIEVESLDGNFYPIEGLRWTKPERQVEMITSINDITQKITCSPEHLVLQQEPNVWSKVGDLKIGDKVVTKFGIASIDSINAIDGIERLCDIQVMIAHSYFANDIMSHNSHWLTAMGANALRSGFDVLHYTMELSETQVGVRYDSNLCDIDSTHVIENKESILESYSGMKKLGRLFIKQYPMNSATIYTIRSHVERLNISKGFTPDLIIIDYADIMRSSRQFDSLRHELKLVYEELRSFAADIQVPLWSASQSNKEGSSSEIVDLGNMSEAYGKAMVADVVVSLSRKPQEKATGHGRLFVAKNRAGHDGLLYPIMIDTARSKFEVTGGPGNLSEQKEFDESEIKKSIRRRLQAVRNDPEISTKDALTSDTEQPEN